MFLTGKKNLNKREDLELIRLYRNKGDREAVGILFERYTHLVFGICLKYLKDVEESKDAVMQIFEKLLTDLLHHDISNFSSWLHSVARNFCLMKLRAAQSTLKREQAFHRHEQVIVESDLNLHQGESENKEKQYQLLEQAISELNDQQQQCIRLFYFEDKSYVDIVEITGFELKKVKSYIQNGKRNLKILMEKQERKNTL